MTVRIIQQGSHADRALGNNQSWALAHSVRAEERGWRMMDHDAKA
jgi:hypothetical protein